MNFKGKILQIALVLTALISASSMALAATQPTDGFDFSIPTDLSGFTIPTDWTGGFDSKAPTAAFDAKQTTWAAPFNMSFTDKSTGSPFFWIWDFGDGSDNSNDQSPTHLFAAAGKYNVTLTVYGAGGDDTISKVISVAASKPSTSKAPVAAFATSVSGRTVKFTDKSTGSPTSYLWDFGDKCTSKDKNPTHKYSKAGKYTVSLKVTNKAGNNKKTGSVTVK
ncbi:MAG: PKD domain-containing protein [Alphaproteobacteria bacterium]|nr:MAG: PKD domain-containing protein [Alphaproteobacteria bacterium]